MGWKLIIYARLTHYFDSDLNGYSLKADPNKILGFRLTS